MSTAAPRPAPAQSARTAAKIARASPPAPEAKAAPKKTEPALPVYLRQSEKPARAGASVAPLDSALRGEFEARFQKDLSAVRVHRDATGPIASTVPGARAVTIGTDIYFAPGKYDPASKEGRALLAHELTHVIQQREAAAASGTRTGNNKDRFETEARRNAEAVHTGGTLAVRERALHSGPQPDDAQPATADPTALHADPKAVEQEEEYHPGFFARQVLKLFPDLRPILAKGVFGWLKEKVLDALDAVIDTVMAPVRAVKSLLEGASAGVSELAGWIKKAAASIAKGDCSVLHEAIDYVEQTASNLMHKVFDPIVEIGKKIGCFFSGLWEKFGAPVLEMMEKVGGWAWQKIKDFAGWIWDKTAVIRDWSGRAWRWLKRKLFGEENEDGTEGEGGIWGWVKGKVGEAWEWITEKLEPVKKPLAVMAGILLVFSPAGPVSLIVGAVAVVIEGVRAIKKYFGTRDGVVNARDVLQKIVLPKLISGIKSFAQTLANGAHSVLGAVKSAHDAVSSAASACADTIFRFLTGLLQFIADRIDDLVQWCSGLTGDFLSWVDRMTSGLAGFLDRVLNALEAIGGVLHDIMKLPFLLMGRIWNAIPACIRDPFVDFFGVQILGRIAIFKTIAGTPEAWAKTKTDVHEIIKTIFIDFDLVGAMKKTFKLLLRVLDVPMELLTAVLGKMADAWDAIKDKPVDFLKNLLRTIKLAFKGFFKNILKHLANGLTGWLTMNLKGTGVTLPTNWTDPGQLFGFVASILGLSVDHVFERLALKLDPDTVKRLRARFNFLTGAWEWIKLVITGQWAALWEKIKESLSNLGKLVMDTIMDWVVDKVVGTVMLQLTATADPTGISEAVVFLIDTYRTIKTVVQYMRQILVMLNTMLDSILGIAAGVLQPAADLVEGAFDKAMPVVIGFLANLANLGDIAEPIQKGLAAVRTRVDQAIDTLIEKGRGLLNFLGGGGSKTGPDDVKIGIEVDWEADDEPHRLWIEEQGGNQVVMMASKKAPVAQQIDDFTDAANALKPKSAAAKKAKAKVLSDIADAVKKAATLNCLVDTLSPLKPTLGKGGVPTTPVSAATANQIASLEPKVEAAERDLVATLEAIEVGLGLAGGDLGSEENPIPLDWSKPRLASYRTFYFGPGPLPKDTFVPQTELSSAYAMSKDSDKVKALKPWLKSYNWSPAAEPIKLYRPTSRQKLPDGTETIGISPEFQVEVGMKIKMTETAGTGGGDALNDILKPFGLSPTKEVLQADHIVERQIGGPDIIPNLWPLNSRQNSVGGGTLRGAKFSPGGQKFVPHLKHKGPGDLTFDEVKDHIGPSKPVYFRIVSTLE
jgi:phage-related protein